VTSGDLRQRVLTGSIWSILAELLAAGGRAISYFFYARLLTPNDFGVVGFCLLWISLFPFVIDNSLSLALINSKDESQRVYSSMFFLNLALSAAGIALLILGSGWAADFLHDGRVRWLLPVMGIQILCNALCGTHIAIARRRFQFRSLLPVRLISSLFSLAVGLPLAFAGFAYWSLAAATIAGGLSQLIAAWVFLPWRPSIVFDWQRIKPLASFASWASVDMGISWLIMSGGGFFLAFFLGEHELGFFRLADQLDITIMSTIFGPLLPVFYSAFCEVSGDRIRSARLFDRFNRVAAILALALTGSILTIAYPLESLIGAKWHGIGGLIVLNVIGDGVFYMTAVTPWFLRANGDARTVATMRVFYLLGLVLAYALTAPHGLRPFLYGKLAVEISIYFVSYAVIASRLSVSALRLIAGQMPLILALSLSAAVSVKIAVVLSVSNGFAALAAGLTVFGLGYGGFVFLKEREFVADIFAMLAKRLRPAAAE